MANQTAHSIQMDLGAGFVSIDSDVLISRYRVSCRYGIFGSGPTDRVAEPGSLTFVLNNSASNSGAKQGYYSPGHANCRSGFEPGIPVRLSLELGNGNFHIPLRGFLETILPTPGTTGPQETHCVVVSWLGLWFAQDNTDTLPLLTDTRTNTAIQQLINLADTATSGTDDLDQGVDILPFAFDDLVGVMSTEEPQSFWGTKRPIAGVVHGFVQSELGFLYELPEQHIKLENRVQRKLAPAELVLTDSKLLDIEVPDAKGRVYNDVTTVYYPRRIDPTDETVLVSLDSAVEVRPGESRTVWANYIDPINEAVSVGATDMQTPEADTDWTANQEADGSGGDHTGAPATVVATFYGSRAKFVLTNPFGFTLYFRGPGDAAGLQARGRGLYTYAPQEIQVEDSASIAKYRRRPIRLELRYQSERGIAQTIAERVLALYKDLANVPTRIQLNLWDFTVGAAIANDDISIGKVVNVSETLTAVDEVWCFIHGVEIEVGRGADVQMWLTVAPYLDHTDMFHLDSVPEGSPGESRLDHGKLWFG